MTAQEQLKEQVNGVALELEAVAEGRYNFYTGEIVDETPDIDEAECNDENYENDFDGGFSRYFEDALDIEYRVDAQLCYKGAIITVAVGGPSIYVDTFEGEVKVDKRDDCFWERERGIECVVLKRRMKSWEVI